MRFWRFLLRRWLHFSLSAGRLLARQSVDLWLAYSLSCSTGPHLAPPVHFVAPKVAHLLGFSFLLAPQGLSCSLSSTAPSPTGSWSWVGPSLCSRQALLAFGAEGKMPNYSFKPTP